MGENDRKKRRGLHLVLGFQTQTFTDYSSKTLTDLTGSDFNLCGYSTFSHSLKLSPKKASITSVLYNGFIK